jgi:hypothetical protein
VGLELVVVRFELGDLVLPVHVENVLGRACQALGYLCILDVFRSMTQTYVLPGAGEDAWIRSRVVDRNLSR